MAGADEQTMRALSIRQPWAELILRGVKTVEYRSRATRSDATSGTPAPTSVPSIRQKRTSENRAVTVPSSGVRSMARSRNRRPDSLASAFRAKTTAPITSRASSHP